MVLFEVSVENFFQYFANSTGEWNWSVRILMKSWEFCSIVSCRISLSKSV